MRGLLLALMVGVLAGCGGGGGGGGSTPTPPDPPPAAALPDTLSVTATAATDIDTPIQFKPSNDVSVSGLSYAWTFGDGDSSQQAQPSHKYLKGGDYRVTLTVSNAAGQSRSASVNVSLDNKAHLAGLGCSEANQGGWCRVYPPNKRVDFADVKFASASVGWAVGSGGSVYRSTDGGASWVEQLSGTTAGINNVWVADAMTAWVGHFGASAAALLMTTDGGASWKPAASPNIFYLDDLIVHNNGGLVAISLGKPAATQKVGAASWTALDAKVQWVQPGGTLWRRDAAQVSRSLDLGASFQAVPGLAIAADAALRFAASDDQHVTVVESRGATHTFWRSQDGGGTWMSSTAFDGTAPSDIRQLGPDTYLYRPERVVYHSTDAGRSYKALPLDTTYSTDIAVLSSQVIIAPLGDAATISLDGGVSWRKMKPPLPDQAFYYSLYGNSSALPKFQLAGSALVSWRWPGNPGVYRSTDGGQSWQPVLGLTPSQNKILVSILPLSSQLILAVSSQGDLLQSRDSGRTWVTRLSNLYSGDKLLRAEANTVWYGGRLRSTDGGDTWQQVGAAAFVNDLWFLDAKRGWARDRNGIMMATQDGGESWLPVCEGAACPKYGASWVFRDADNGIAASYDGTYKTTDGGKTWAFTPAVVKDLPLPTSTARYSLAWPSATQVWASFWTCSFRGSSTPALCGTALQRSLDGGVSWTQVNLDINPSTLNWLAFLDADHGWISSPSASRMSLTQDGGLTWTARSLPFALSTYGVSLGASSPVSFLDMRTGWALDSQGSLYATGTGGATSSAQPSSSKTGPNR